MAAHSFSLCSPTTSRAPHYDCRRPKSFSLSTHQSSLHNPWLGPNNLSLQSSHLETPLPKRRPLNATVSLSLPTAKPDRVGKLPKWSMKAIISFGLAEWESRRTRQAVTTTGHLLLGMLLEGTNLAAQFLFANGITPSKVRAKINMIMEEIAMSTHALDRIPLNESLQRALDWAVDEKLKYGGSGEITTIHLLLAVWSDTEDSGHQIMATLGFNEEKAKVLETLISKDAIIDV